MTRSERRSVRALTRSLRAGVLPNPRPDKALRARAALRRWGPTPAAACSASAIWSPHKPAIIDDHGTLSFAELDRRTNAIANSLAASGLTPRQSVALMARNERSPVEIVIAASKLGLNVIHLDPDLPKDASARILADSAPRALFHDEEFSDRLRILPPGCQRILTHPSTGPAAGARLLEELLHHGGASAPPPVPSSVPRNVTFRVPHGHAGPGRRTVRGSLVTPGVLSCRLPLPPRQRTMISAPLSRPWGHLHLLLALRLSSTILLHRRFDPLQALASIDAHRPHTLALLPGMLEEILSLPRETLAWYDTSAVRVIAMGEPKLAEELAMPAIARFGAILYGLRGPSIVTLSSPGESSPIALTGSARAA